MTNILPEKTLINVFGKMCTGKTTLVEQLMTHYRGLYCVDFDVVKRQLSGYYWRDDRTFATNLTLETLNNVVTTLHPIITLLPPPSTKDIYDTYIRTAQDKGYKIIDVLMTASKEVLTERYRRRLDVIAKNNSNTKVRTMEEFLEELDQDMYVSSDALIFDSGELSSGEILNKVVRHISE